MNLKRTCGHGYSSFLSCWLPSPAPSSTSWIALEGCTMATWASFSFPSCAAGWRVLVAALLLTPGCAESPSPPKTKPFCLLQAPLRRSPHGRGPKVAFAPRAWDLSVRSRSFGGKLLDTSPKSGQHGARLLRFDQIPLLLEAPQGIAAGVDRVFRVLPRPIRTWARSSLAHACRSGESVASAEWLRPCCAGLSRLRQNDPGQGAVSHRRRAYRRGVGTVARGRFPCSLQHTPGFVVAPLNPISERASCAESPDTFIGEPSRWSSLIERRRTASANAGSAASCSTVARIVSHCSRRSGSPSSSSMRRSRRVRSRAASKSPCIALRTARLR